MAIICNARHDASRVDWDKNPGCFASDFGSARNTRLFSQVWDDACDVGFVLVSPKTGNETVWAISETIDNPNKPDEIAGWKLTPIRESVSRFPKIKNITLTIWND